ncbi:MAG: hypothetical protein ACRC5W_04510 [Cetobacterium sp.]
MKKKCHPNYLKYEDFIKSHQNYEKMPAKDTWVKASKSLDGQARSKWWKEKRKELDLERYATLAETCREIHPTKYHICQVCGKSSSIYYIYPNANSLKKINEIYLDNKIDVIENSYDTDIYEIFQNFEEINLKDKFKNIFALSTLSNDSEKIIEEIDCIKKTKNSRLTPGVMSNAPDRLDGFHSYNACCRPLHDKGRSKENLNKYGEDRRAYESWSSGNWKKASWLMKEIGKYEQICPQNCDDNKIKKMSADHIGPISLGFSHSPHFQAMCKNCNSSKNNRMTEDDLEKLFKLEKLEKEVVSKHSKICWDLIKNSSELPLENKRNIMRENLGNILYLFGIISENGYYEYLIRFLNPEYSFYTYEFDKEIEFENLCLGEGIIERKIYRTENYNNCKRYIRKSFDSLSSYQDKTNRRINFIIEEETFKKEIKELLESLKDSKKDNSSMEFLENLDNVIEKIKTEKKNPIEFFKIYKEKELILTDNILENICKHLADDLVIKYKS